jgi:hypothetical protein
VPRTEASATGKIRFQIHEHGRFAPAHLIAFSPLKGSPS